MDTCVQVIIEMCFHVSRQRQAEESWGVESIQLSCQPFHMLTVLHI